MSNTRDIEALRTRIDALDQEIVTRLDERARLALAIGHAKKTAGKAVFDPERERQVLARVRAAATGIFPTATLEFIYREIMSACRSLEEPARVAYLGPEATFSHAAALRQFGTSATLLPQADMADIFREVERGNAAYGVVPVENLIEGAVTSTLDLFPDSDVFIVAELYQEVMQNLLSREADMSAVRVIYSHPQAMAQCRTWLRKNMAGVHLETVSSTGEAARLAAQGTGAAAIGSLAAAELYGLQVLAKSIEDIPNNYTRFLVIAREPAPAPTTPKTSLLAALKDEPGALYRMLAPLAEAKVNMTKIESRPLKRRPWEYRFFIDVDGNPADTLLAGVLETMKKACTELRILGTYEKAQRPTGVRV